MIETERTVLKPMSRQDAPALFSYRSLPVVYRYQAWVPRSLDDALAFILRYSAQIAIEEGDWRQLGIYHKAHQALIGDCGFRVFEFRQAEIGYTIAPPYQRQRFGSEVVGSLVNHLFEERDLQRLVASTDPANIGSIRILKRIGFRMEGHSPKSVQIRGEWKDEFLFSILREDWAART
jgi:RimJ/RimL family protein N-acetyltransferase